MDPILSVRNLVTEFATGRGTLAAVRGVSFDLYPGETLGIVGESGSGKSVTVLSILGLLAPSGRVVQGQVRFRGQDLLQLGTNERRALQGKELATIFQDPMSSLNPVLSVGAQIVESIRFHQPKVSRGDAVQRAVDLLRLVGVPNAEQRIRDFPHQYSGGMRQRAMIAMALVNDPAILIADEPTTALDVTTQAQIMKILLTAKEKTGASVIFVTHDLGLIAETADRVVVMYAGSVVEAGTVEQVFGNPRHPYTHGLLASSPRIDVRTDKLLQIPGLPPSPWEVPEGCAFNPRCHQAQGRELCGEAAPPLQVLTGLPGPPRTSACHFAGEVFEEPSLGHVDGTAERLAVETDGNGPALEIADLKVHFPIRSGLLRRQIGTVRAVDGVNLTLGRGETLGIVGESGCGKTTTGRAVVRLVDATEGRIVVGGDDITQHNYSQMRPVRRRLQIVFQDPYSSLDPRFKVGALIGEALRIHGSSRQATSSRVREVLEMVGLGERDIDRYPHEFSGGQRQRIAIARSIVLDPDVLVLDEPVSALDVSVQAQIINLLIELQAMTGMAYIFIAHDLAVVRQIATRVAVMYLGRIVEIGDCETVFERPSHPYTQALLSAVPIAARESRERARTRIVLEGDVPSPANPPSGCHFRTRCFKVEDLCAEKVPLLAAVEQESHQAACHFAEPVKIL